MKKKTALILAAAAILLLGVLAVVIVSCQNQGVNGGSTGPTEASQNTTEEGLTTPDETFGTIPLDTTQGEPAPSGDGSDPTDGGFSANGEETTQPTEETTQGEVTTQPEETTSRPAEETTQEEVTTQPDGPAVYTITYEGLEEAVHTNPASYTAQQAEQIVLWDPTPRAGYVFAGWFIGQQKITTLSGQTGDLVITAQWVEKPSEGGGIELPDIDF